MRLIYWLTGFDLRMEVYAAYGSMKINRKIHDLVKRCDFMNVSLLIFTIDLKDCRMELNAIFIGILHVAVRD